MITYEIQKAKPIEQGGFLQRATHALNRRSQQYAANEQMFMGKFAFTKYIDEVVRPKLPVGCFCTLTAIKVQDDHIPVPLFKVADIQEVAWMAPISDGHNEPRCVSVISNITTAPIAYCPSMLRRLTEKEVSLVYIRDQAPGIAADPVIFDIESETREAFERYSE